MCASLPVACVDVLVGVPVFVRVCTCVLGSKALKEGGEVQPNGALRERVLVQCSGLGGGTEGADEPCLRQ